MALAIEELHNHTNYMKILGSYPRRSGDLDSIPTTPAAPATEGPEPVAPIEIQPSTKKYPRASIESSGRRSTMRVGNIEFGPDQFVMISGPCAVESREQIFDSAALVKQVGAQLLRGGAFKPRSSPYSFQGLGFEGLDLLVEAGRASVAERLV